MTHKDLDVWKQSIDLVLKIYKICNEIPNDEKFGLIAQIKRSVISIPSNIAEGAGRSSTKEFVRFLDIANGSLSELETQLIIVSKLEFAKSEEVLEEEIIVIRKMIYKLKQSLIKKLKYT